MREIYLALDPEHPADNVTEVQVVRHEWDRLLAEGVDQVLGAVARQQVMEGIERLTPESSDETYTCQTVPDLLLVRCGLVQAAMGGDSEPADQGGTHGDADQRPRPVHAGHHLAVGVRGRDVARGGQKALSDFDENARPPLSELGSYKTWR